MNKYAALPSFHVGWNVLACVVLFRSVKSVPVRIFAVASPLLMSIAVVLTGNHWVVDGFVGTALAMIGLYAAHRLGWLTRRWVEPEVAESTDSAEEPESAKEPELARVGPAGIEPATERL